MLSSQTQRGAHWRVYGLRRLTGCRAVAEFSSLRGRNTSRYVRDGSICLGLDPQLMQLRDKKEAMEDVTIEGDKP